MFFFFPIKSRTEQIYVQTVNEKKKKHAFFQLLLPNLNPDSSSSTNFTSPTTAAPLNISVVSSGSITFEVPASFSNSGGNFTYDFGDGTSTKTNDTKVTHVYENPGNYVFTLKLEGTPEVRVLESYAVTVTPPTENPLVKYTWPIVTSIVAGLSVATITALIRRRKKGPT